MVTRKGLLYTVLAHLVRSIDRHATIPALHYVKLDADGKVLCVQATDIITHVTATIPCEGLCK